MNEIIYASAATLTRAIRDKELSSAEVVRACLERIEAINPRLNAVVQLDPEAALERAKQADEELSRGMIWGPLHGLPMTIKDSLDTAGMVTTWGTPGRAGFVPAKDATVVKRLKAAGAILLGKTNTPELTLSYQTDNPIYGRTLNPYDPDRTPGGSSGGAAAIVASGGSPIEIGSDTGGSIRLPAHFCGIAGIKPTSGRVPRTGHAIGPGGLRDSFTQLGPMARYVEDLALLLPIISGPDGKDPAVVPMTLGDPGAVDLNGRRLAFHTDNGVQTPTEEIMATVRAAAKVLADAGLQVEEKRPPGIEASREIYNDLLLGWDGGAYVRMLLERAGTSLDQTSLGRFLEAPSLPAADLVRLIDRWDLFRRQMLSFLDDYELILSPVNAFPAIGHGETGRKILGFSYTNTYNLTGWPGVVVRAGVSNEGLPIGIQIVARPWREDLALAAAAVVEAQLGGWQPPPEVAV